MNKLEILLEHFYKIMWCEFSAKEIMSDDEIIYLIGVSGLNTLHDYGRLKACGRKDGHKKLYLNNLEPVYGWALFYLRRRYEIWAKIEKVLVFERLLG